MKNLRLSQNQSLEKDQVVLLQDDEMLLPCRCYVLTEIRHTLL